MAAREAAGSSREVRQLCLLLAHKLRKHTLPAFPAAMGVRSRSPRTRQLDGYLFPGFTAHMRRYLDVDVSLMPPLLLRLSRALRRPIMPGTVRMHDGGERYIEIRLSCKGEASKVATTFDCLISCQTYAIENRVKDPGHMALHRHREGRHEMRDYLCRQWFEPEPGEPLCCDDEMFDIKATLSLEEADEAFFEA